MAFSSSDADALRAALATGAVKVRYADGREVTYRSLDEMERILGTIERAIAGTGSCSRTSVVGF